jgi:membrane protease YdiL (CAAX protease family)
MDQGDGQATIALRAKRLYLTYASKPWARLFLVAIMLGALLTSNGEVTLLVEVLLGVVLLDAYIGRPYRRGEPVKEFGLDLDRAVPQFAIGALGATAIMSASIAIFALAGWYRVDEFTLNVGGFLYYVLLFFAVAVVEEVLSRGMIWRLIERRAGTVLALIGSSLFFGLGHFLNPSATLWSGIAIALHAGLLLGALFIVTRSLWVPIGGHFAWNLFEGPVFGTEVSGLDTDALIEATTTGPELWTGGAFGPEAGLVTVLLGVIPALVLLAYAWRKGMFRRPTPATTSPVPSEPD